MNEALPSRRNQFFFRAMALALLLVPCVMIVLLYGLGPRGTCEADLNARPMILVWLASTFLAGSLALALFLVRGWRIVPGGGWRSVPPLVVASCAAAAVFVIGLIVLLTDTTCVD